MPPWCEAAVGMARPPHRAPCQASASAWACGRRGPRRQGAEGHQVGREVRTRPVIAPPVHSGQGDFGKLSVAGARHGEGAFCGTRWNASSPISPWVSRWEEGQP